MEALEQYFKYDQINQERKQNDVNNVLWVSLSFT